MSYKCRIMQDKKPELTNINSKIWRMLQSILHICNCLNNQVIIICRFLCLNRKICFSNLRKKHFLKLQHKCNVDPCWSTPDFAIFLVLFHLCCKSCFFQPISGFVSTRNRKNVFPLSLQMLISSWGPELEQVCFTCAGFHHQSSGGEIAPPTHWLGYIADALELRFHRRVYY